MSDFMMIFGASVVALVVGVGAGVLGYRRVTVGSRRKLARLTAKVEYLDRQVAIPRPPDLRPLVDALPDPLFLTDEQDRVVLVNTAAARLLELPAVSVVGKPFVSVVTDQSLLELWDEVRRASGERSQAQRELKLVRSGNRHVFQAVGIHSGAAVLVLLRDVTKMATIVQMKTDFVSNAGHELRTPVAAIKVAFETLKDAMVDDPEQTARCVKIMTGHLGRLEDMLTDLLDLARVESPELQPQVRAMKPSEVFGLVSAPLGPVAREKGLELKFEGPGESNAVNTDPRLLNLVLKNLVENAIKFTPPAGAVTVKLHRRAEGGFTVAVADSGIGIAPEHQARVFERFYQVDGARTGFSTRGTGLGLAIVKHAVATLGGELRLDSTPGHGTTITCDFPEVGVSGEIE